MKIFFLIMEELGFIFFSVKEQVLFRINKNSANVKINHTIPIIIYT